MSASALLFSGDHTCACLCRAMQWCKVLDRKSLCKLPWIPGICHHNPTRGKNRFNPLPSTADCKPKCAGAAVPTLFALSHTHPFVSLQLAMLDGVEITRSERLQATQALPDLMDELLDAIKEVGLVFVSEWAGEAREGEGEGVEQEVPPGERSRERSREVERERSRARERERSRERGREPERERECVCVCVCVRVYVCERE